MNSIQTILCSALSLSFLLSTDPVAAQSANDWGCNVGHCDVKSTPPTEIPSQRPCVNNHKNFYVEGIENAVSGPQTGSFNFVGSLVHEGPDAQTLDTYYSDPMKRDFLKDLVLTVHAPDNVEDLSVRLLDAEGKFLGAQIQAGANTTVLFWSHDFDPSSADSSNMKLEVKGNIAVNSGNTGSPVSPMLWFGVRGTRCKVL